MSKIKEEENFEKFKNIETCPIRNVISRFSGKWSMLILCILSDHDSLRFNQLGRAIPDISPKVLTSNLKILEEDGLIKRQLYPEIPPRVEYSLTPKGRRLMPIIHNLIEWATENWKK